MGNAFENIVLIWFVCDDKQHIMLYSILILTAKPNYSDVFGWDEDISFKCETSGNLIGCIKLCFEFVFQMHFFFKYSNRAMHRSFCSGAYERGMTVSGVIELDKGESASVWVASNDKYSTIESGSIFSCHMLPHEVCSKHLIFLKLNIEHGWHIFFASILVYVEWVPCIQAC